MTGSALATTSDRNWLARFVSAAVHGDPERSSTEARRSLRDWLVDLAIQVICLVTTGAYLSAGIALASEEYGSGVPALDLPLTLLTLLTGPLLWWRRRWPVAIAAICFVTLAFSGANNASCLVAILTVALHRRTAVALWTTAGYLVASTISGSSAVLGLNTALLEQQPDLTTTVVGIGFAVLQGVAQLVWGLILRSRRLLLQSLRERAHAAEVERDLRVAQARYQERAQIAREMHDVLAHRLSLLSLHAGALEYRPDAPPADIAQAAGVVRASAHQALIDLRDVIGVLRGPALEGTEQPDRPLPTLADLPQLVEESRQVGVRVTFTSRLESAEQVPPVLARCMYRIVQEGLTNARKHATGALTDVLVDGGPGAGITVEVRNRLPIARPGQPAIPGAGAGLAGLAERTDLAGGRLEQGPTPDGHFRLHGWLPWPA